MREIFAKHDKAVLNFSGGKDSLACLWLIEPWWDKTVVMWTNTGAAFQETIDLMTKVKELVPHFHEVKTSQPRQIEANGYPVDLLPILNNIGFNKPAMQSFFDCCMTNLMRPTYEAVRAIGATLLIRGQKTSDKLKGPLNSGAVIDGVEHLYPIEGWTDESVIEFLQSTPLGVPEHYSYFNSSLDCWSCTAFLHENIGKMRYMRERHPERHAIVAARLAEIQRATELANLIDAALNA